MKLSINIRQSFSNLVNSKMRSLLAILGILIGTASVVALISSSMLATNHALAQFKDLGTNLVSMILSENYAPITSSKTSGVIHKLTLAELQQLKQRMPSIVAIAPYVNSYQTVSEKGKSLDAQIVGVTRALFDVSKLRLAQGRTVGMLDRYGHFCVIGNAVASQLKARGVKKLIGAQLKIGSGYYTVVGVAKPWPSNLFITANLNQAILVPLPLSLLFDKYAMINSVLFRLQKHASVTQVQQQLRHYFSKKLSGMQLHFRSPQQIIKVMTKQRSTFTWLLVGIGCISLLVGGIGVMNIMLVSVIERRREIGIRMAIGARAKDIRRMFLIESVVLTVFGGLLGVILGVIIAIILAKFAAWQYVFFAWPPILGLVVSVVVGVVSGYYPAYQASKLDPISSLQTD